MKRIHVIEATLIVAVIGLIAAMCFLAGCSGGGQTIERAPIATSQPSNDGINVAAGNAIVSKLDTALAKINEIKVAVTTTATGVNYQSNIGVGVIGLLALVIAGLMFLLWYDELGDQKREIRDDSEGRRERGCVELDRAP